MIKATIYLIIVSIVIYSILLTAGCGGSNSSINPGPKPTPNPEPGGLQPVIFVSGGAVDDSVSCLLLTTMENIDLKGVIVINADCIPSYAMQVQWRTQSYINDSNTPVTLSDSRGWNPFPWEYRNDCISQDKMSALSGYGNNPDWPPFPSGESLLINILSQAIATNKPVIVLNTCPITMLRNVLEENPHLEGGIESVIMMGGAIDVPGNLDPETIPVEIANPLAEWNCFFDPYSFDWILKNTSFPLVLFPLDVTDEVPLSEEFLLGLESQSEHFRYSELVSQNYDLVEDETFYRMWNSVTTAYLARPDFFQLPVPTNLSIITDGYNQGATVRDSGGRTVYVVFDMADKEGFYSYVLNQFKRNYDDE